MKEIKVAAEKLRMASEKGADDFLKFVADTIYTSVDGRLDEQTLPQLNANQTTLLAYLILRDEVMDGGFIQLIYNGYGDFIFKNPFAKVIKGWGMDELSRLIRSAYPVFVRRKEQIMVVESDEDFMALFEQMPDFESFDDSFVENEEEWTGKVADFVSAHISDFVVTESTENA